MEIKKSIYRDYLQFLNENEDSNDNEEIQEQISVLQAKNTILKKKIKSSYTNDALRQRYEFQIKRNNLKIKELRNSLN